MIDTLRHSAGRAGWRLALAGVLLIGSPSSVVPAQAGYPEAVLAYDRGEYETALSEFHTLAQRGHADAEFMLGAMHFYGKGVPRDDVLAAIWFYKAATKGNPMGQLAFGSLHIRGLGVQQDLVKAYVWLSLAARRDIPGLSRQAATLRDEAARLMGPNELDRARAEAEDWRPSRSGLSPSSVE